MNYSDRIREEACGCRHDSVTGIKTYLCKSHDEKRNSDIESFARELAEKLEERTRENVKLREDNARLQREISDLEVRLYQAQQHRRAYGLNI
jgi:predicted nuclease with TOPRIM domain